MSGQLVAQLHRRAQAVVLVARRHLHVDHGDVGPVRERPAQEVVGVAGLGDDVEAGLGEQPRDALAQQDVVLADHDAQGGRHGPTVLQIVASRRRASPQRAVRQILLGQEADRADGCAAASRRRFRIATR